GDTVSITARLDQHDGGEVLVHLAYADSATVSRLMRFEAGAYHFELPDVTRDFSFHVTAGDARTLRHEVRVLRRPMVREYRIRYDFPDYTGRAPINVLSPDGRIEVPAGTEVTLTVVASEPLAEATLRIADEAVEVTPGIEPSSITAQFTVNENSTGELVLTSAEGAVSAEPNLLRIRALPDAAPIVRMLLPDADQRLHPRDVLQVEYQALDDYGLREVRLMLRVNGNVRDGIEMPMKGDLRSQ